MFFHSRHTSLCPYDLKLVVATTLNLLVYGLPASAGTPQILSPTKAKSKSKGKKGKPTTQNNLELLKTVELPSSSGAADGTFRSAR